jgi:hypothetical protein
MFLTVPVHARSAVASVTMWWFVRVSILVDKSVPPTTNSNTVQLAVIAHHNYNLEDESRREVARE